MKRIKGMKGMLRGRRNPGSTRPRKPTLDNPTPVSEFEARLPAGWIERASPAAIEAEFQRQYREHLTRSIIWR